MKFRNLFLAVVATGIFSACSNGMDEAINNNGNETNNGEKAYASFAIQMPNSGASARSVDTEVGLEAESVVTDITLLFFDKDTKNLTDIKTYGVGEFTKSSSTYQKNLVVTKGERYIYAFVNAQAAIKGLVTNDNGAGYNFICGTGAETAASMSISGKFAMSNATTAQVVDISYATELEAIAHPITIPVERAVAKIQYVGTAKPTFDIKKAGDGSKIGSVQLTDMRLTNMNTKYYYLKRVSANGDNPVIGGAVIEGPTPNYIVDPNFREVTPDANAIFTQGTYTTLDATVTNSNLYCLENTMIASAQYNGVTTGVMFKAQLDMTSATNKTFYRYEGAIYASEAEVKAAADITVSTANWEVSDWKAKNVDYYKNGICYYPVWIKHIDNDNPAVMGPMEFGVVRNNVYKLSVKNISGIGMPEDVIDPNNPDEEASAYIEVKVEILKWTVRTSNENIEL